MPDDEGYMLPGELSIGSYAALEGDLGEKLCGPLGFTAPAVEWVADEGSFVPGGFRTGPPAAVVFTVRGGGS